MNISISEHHVQLHTSQKDYITEKMETIVRHLGRISNNESAEIKVTITQEDTKAEEDRFLCEITLTLPKKRVLRCDHRSLSPEAATDLCVEKLKKQVEKLRTTLIG